MSKILAGTNLIHKEINPGGITEADIVIVIPSFNEAANIGLTTQKAALGLKKFFPHLKSVIINCDNNSEDGTAEAFFKTECEAPRIYISSPPGIRGKGANLINAFRRAASLSARVVVVLDANILSIKSSWIQRLAAPVLEGAAEYVAPLYVRHKYDGPISRGLAYPLMRALFGRRVLQPIHVDHAFSGRLNDIYLNSDWELDDRGYKSDLNMLSLAIMNSAPICQSYMAYPRITTLADLDYDLPKSFSHVAGALFKLMEETSDFWARINRSRPTIMSCADETALMPAPHIDVDSAYLIKGFIDMGRRFREAWAEFLPQKVTDFLERQLATADAGGRPVIPVDLWRESVFAAALAFRRSDDEKRRRITAALAPLFYIKGLTVYGESAAMTERQYNALLEEEALCFEQGKKDLTARWNLA